MPSGPGWPCATTATSSRAGVTGRSRSAARYASAWPRRRGNSFSGRLLAQDAHPAGERVAVVGDDPPGRQDRAWQRRRQHVGVRGRDAARRSASGSQANRSSLRRRTIPDGPVIQVCTRSAKTARLSPSHQTSSPSVVRWRASPCVPLRTSSTQSPTSPGPIRARRSSRRAWKAQPAIGPFASSSEAVTSGPRGISGRGVCVGTGRRRDLSHRSRARVGRLAHHPDLDPDDDPDHGQQGGPEPDSTSRPGPGRGRAPSYGDGLWGADPWPNRRPAPPTLDSVVSPTGRAAVRRWGQVDMRGTISLPGPAILAGTRGDTHTPSLALTAPPRASDRSSPQGSRWVYHIRLPK